MYRNCRSAGTVRGGTTWTGPSAGRYWAPAGALGHIPVDVAEHGQNIFAATGKHDRPLQDHWAGGQRDLSRVSSRSQVIIATQSGHYIYLDQPQLALDVINAVIAES
jgi:hypothetical protein